MSAHAHASTAAVAKDKRTYALLTKHALARRSFEVCELDPAGKPGRVLWTTVRSFELCDRVHQTTLKRLTRLCIVKRTAA